jgi:hypothetical protein
VGRDAGYRSRTAGSMKDRSWSGAWRRGSMCEHSRRRYAASSKLVQDPRA